MRAVSSAAYSSDTSVQGTNDDAQVSKMSCAKAGYFKDDFIHFFVKKSSRRSPLINRGYYSRHAALRHLLLDFLKRSYERGIQCQVLCLGAGFDTTWFQLHQDSPHLLPTRYLEVDFKEVTQRKVTIISGQDSLKDRIKQHVSSASTSASVPGKPACVGTNSVQPSDLVPPAPFTAASVRQQSGGEVAAVSIIPDGVEAAAVEYLSGAAPILAVKDAGEVEAGVKLDVQGGTLISSCYSILPVDLKDLTALEAATQRAGLDPDLPTYILSECVLVYMEPSDSAAVIKWLAGHFKTAALVVYEQIKPDDAFGQQMCSNLESRGCPLRGIISTPTLEAHCQRMRIGGWSDAKSHDMDTIYKLYLDPVDRARMERLEIFDEFEEWHMIQEHYSITIGMNNDNAKECTSNSETGSFMTGFGFT
ncbi:hypothetical protein CEUSTIGMA_g6744.t1 [Chlamydomonas eustigma]|uniref:Leucine carboxyl methyltransferase 1 homolog n=1 Tax=Chlamydomonas eustigma TaxID=1157962 RepID=A0A250X8A0_9CHLO|nr:hypothetical protein CEUSTIGMA_g6744.t1 [Chlamydomonas eustigma]|eukprot:GAX79303.1 hypothetical protein CEUSTIGMA_g6744.t1 [Chlamydomonas eustigma]